jgi:tRNA pseudouridine38-40 synthase
MRYFFHIGFHGTRYAGWQKLSSALTVQEAIETALTRIFKYQVNIVGCGRTDAGVHASQFFFHTELAEEPDFDLLFRLNKVLPDDIAVFDIIPMQGDPHARFDGVKRSYDYFIHNYKDPFLSKFSSFYPDQELDLDAMAKAVSIMPKYNDYRALCKMPDRVDNTRCNVMSAGLYIDEQGYKLRFNITANRFLNRMIRITVGRLLEIGRGQMSADEFEHYIANKETPKIIIPAKPDGLFLSKVTYRYLDIEPRSAFSLLGQSEWHQL